MAVCGVGIKDTEDIVYWIEKQTISGMLVSKKIWCPFYKTWSEMIRRCYSKKLHAKRPTYSGCSVFEDWIYFSKFKDWMQTQDWEGKELDKDILFEGNKIYGPDTCVFVKSNVNGFILNSKINTIENVGSILDKSTGKYKSYCICVNTHKQKYLGTFDTPEEAHKKWLQFKIEQAKILSLDESDERIKKALVNRYQNKLDILNKPS